MVDPGEGPSFEVYGRQDPVLSLRRKTIERFMEEGVNLVVLLAQDQSVIGIGRHALAGADRAQPFVGGGLDADIAGLDIGSWFAPEFSDERVPLLSEALELARGRIGVLIELKPTGATMAVPWGEPVTKGGTTGRLSPGAGPADPELIDRLKRWRLAQATSQGVPAYVIFNDATLEALAARRPSSGSALLEIPGIGPAKLEAYGEDLLDLLAD